MQKTYGALGAIPVFLTVTTALWPDVPNLLGQ